MTTLDELQSTTIGVPSDPWTGPVPVPDLDSAAYWAGLNDGRLMIQRCDDCKFLIHPPLAGCPRCLSARLTPTPLSGQARLYSFTVCNREIAPGVAPPYVVGLVDLVEQDNLRLVTMLANVTVTDIRIGMPVQVIYHRIGEATLALFEPSTATDGPQ